MKMFFEDGDLMMRILNLGFLPYNAQLTFELHYQNSTSLYTVAMLYNWVEQPIPGACKNVTRCPYSSFIQYISNNSMNNDSYTTLCGLTADQIFKQRVNTFYATQDAARIVVQSQWMRVVELYVVMMLIIVISWIIYSVFRVKDEPKE